MAFAAVAAADPEASSRMVWALVVRGFRRTPPHFGSTEPSRERAASGGEHSERLRVASEYEQACIQLLPANAGVTPATFISNLQTSGIVRSAAAWNSNIKLRDILRNAEWLHEKSRKIMDELGRDGELPDHEDFAQAEFLSKEKMDSLVISGNAAGVLDDLHAKAQGLLETRISEMHTKKRQQGRQKPANETEFSP